MNRWSAVSGFTAIAVLMTGGCNIFESDDEGDEFDPVVAEAYLQRNWTKVPRITEALARIILTVNGTPQPGVTFTTISGGVQGTVGVDLDGNSSFETTVDARLIFHNPQLGIAGGGVLTVTDINAASTGGTAQTEVEVSGGGSTVEFFNGTADLRPTNGPSRITVTDADFDVTATFGSPVILGFADFEVGNVSATMFFEPNGQGGFRIRVESDDFEGFVVP